MPTTYCRQPSALTYYLSNSWGFVYSEGDINPDWSLDPASLAQWRVAAFHSWTKAYHSVTKVFTANRTIFFGEEASFGYGDMTYCSQSAL